MLQLLRSAVTYDHSSWRIRDPVCSPIVKPRSGELVLRSVTTGESSLLYVLLILFIFAAGSCKWVYDEKLLVLFPLNMGFISRYTEAEGLQCELAMLTCQVCKCRTVEDWMD